MMTSTPGPPVTVNYIDAKAAELAGKLPDCPAELLRLYALLALTTGKGTTLENVHDAWAAWRTVTNPGHKSLVPFGALTREVQELDEPYMLAIREVSPGT